MIFHVNTCAFVAKVKKNSAKPLNKLTNVCLILELRPVTPFSRPAAEPPILSQGLFQETAKGYVHLH